MGNAPGMRRRGSTCIGVLPEYTNERGIARTLGTELSKRKQVAGH